MFQAYIIDGKTGKLIDNPTNDSVRTQVGGLTLSMENYGYDMFLFWTQDYSGKCHLKKYNLISSFFDFVF